MISYQLRVQVSRLEHRPGTREAIQYDVYEKLVDTRVSEASVTGLGKDVYCGIMYVSLHIIIRSLFWDLLDFLILAILDSIIISSLLIAVAEVPYNVTVKALNLAGCGEESQMYCFTQEGGKVESDSLIRDHNM